MAVDILIKMEDTSKYYKCTGSTVVWVLRNDLVDAFVVWMLAQQYNRHQNGGKATGKISSGFFLSHIAISMGVGQATAKKRLEKALRNRFLEPSGVGCWITGHRKLLEIALDDQLRRHQNGEAPDPRILISGDTEYTGEMSNWIIPHDIEATKSLLLGKVLQQWSMIGRGYESQGSLLGLDRRTLMRRIEDANVATYHRYIVFDPRRILVKSSADLSTIHQAFFKAEDLYRSLGFYLPGRRFFHSKYITHSTLFDSGLRTQDFTHSTFTHSNFTHSTFTDSGLANSLYLAIQLSSLHLGLSNTREVPFCRGSRNWMRRAGMAELRTRDSCGLESKDSVKMASHQYITQTNGGRDGSRNRGDINNLTNIIKMNLGFAQQIIENLECSDLILKLTEAEGIRSIYSGTPCTFQESVSGVTPNLLPRETTIFP